MPAAAMAPAKGQLTSPLATKTTTDVALMMVPKHGLEGIHFVDVAAGPSRPAR